jgi:hypothetical protein
MGGFTWEAHASRDSMRVGARRLARIDPGAAKALEETTRRAMSLNKQDGGILEDQEPPRPSNSGTLSHS